MNQPRIEHGLDTTDTFVRVPSVFHPWLKSSFEVNRISRQMMHYQNRAFRDARYPSSALSNAMLVSSGT